MNSARFLALCDTFCIFRKIYCLCLVVSRTMWKRPSLSLFTVRTGSPLWPHDVRRRKGARYSRLARRRYLLSFKAYWSPDASTSLTFKNLRSDHIVFMFCIYLRTNRDMGHLHHKLIGFYNRDENCFLRGTNFRFK